MNRWHGIPFDRTDRYFLESLYFPVYFAEFYSHIDPAGVE